MSAPGDTVVVIPCYDEAARLDAERLQAYAAEPDGARLLFVDDGSRDATPERLEALARAVPERFAWMRLERNGGKAEAVRRGMLRALESRPAYAGYWDADLAAPLDAVAALRGVLEARPGVDCAFGARVQLLGRSIERSTLRHYGGRVFATAASLALGLPIYDTQCGAKLFRATPEVAALFAEPFATRWSFDVELVARLVAARGRRAAREAIFEHPLAVWRDVPGGKVRARDLAIGLFEVARIRHHYLRRARS